MIKLFKATKPQRKRDKKRRRFILQVGAKMYHVSYKELEKLFVQISRQLPYSGAY